MRIMAWGWMTICAPMSALLCSAEKDEGGTDGAGGDATTLTEEQLTEVDKRIHGAVSSQLTRFRTSFEKDLDGKLNGKLNPISESLKTLTERAETPPDDDKGKDKGTDDAATKELKKAEARIADLETKNRDAEAHAQSTEKKRLASEEQRALTEALREAGCDDKRLRGAVAVLYAVDERVGRDEEGNIVMKMQRAGYVEDVKLDVGIGEWLATEEGKSYLPARGVGGSGAQGSHAKQRTGKPGTKEQKVADARRLLAGAHGIRTE